MAKEIKQRLEKPKIGQPCNGCGLCCMIQVCRNGALVQGLIKHPHDDPVEGPCPALVTNSDGSYSCGVVKDPKKYIRKSPYREDVLRREFSLLIGAGTGCDDIGYDTDPQEVKKLDDLHRADTSDPERMERIKMALKIVHNNPDWLPW